MTPSIYRDTLEPFRSQLRARVQARAHDVARAARLVDIEALRVARIASGNALIVMAAVMFFLAPEAARAGDSALLAGMLASPWVVAGAVHVGVHHVGRARLLRRLALVEQAAIDLDGADPIGALERLSTAPSPLIVVRARLFLRRRASIERPLLGWSAIAPMMLYTAIALLTRLLSPSAAGHLHRSMAGSAEVSFSPPVFALCNFALYSLINFLHCRFLVWSAELGEESGWHFTSMVMAAYAICLVRYAYATGPRFWVGIGVFVAPQVALIASRAMCRWACSTLTREHTAITKA
jgi:hypothetical protein